MAVHRDYISVNISEKKKNGWGSSSDMRHTFVPLRIETFNRIEA